MNGDSRSAIRNAFASGEFAKAQRLWDDYAAQLRLAIQAGTASETLMTETRELIEWARMVVISFRAGAAARLNRARVAQIYEAPPASRTGFVRTSL